MQWDVTMAPSNQWNAVPDKHRNHADDELVDRLLVEEGPDELTAAHQPDILAGLFAKAAHEWADGAVHKFHSWWGVGRWRLMREHDGAASRVELCSQFQAHLIRLSANNRRVNRLRELVHTVEAGGSGSGCQPPEIPVRSCDITVGAGRDVDDDVAALRHE